MMIETSDNGRQYYRIDLNIPAAVRLRSMGTRSFATGERFDVEVLNVSGGGLCFESTRELPVSPLLAWQLLLEFEGEKFNLLGQLVWKKPGQFQGSHQYGVKFIFVDEKDQHQLMNKLNRMQVLLKLRQKRQNTSHA
ncbi:MAG: PilZ domain-containing protein [Tumebacillaceae bacterium]